MQPLLERNDAGDVKIRWWPLVFGLFIYCVGFFATGLTLQHFFGAPRRPAMYASFIIVAALPTVILLYVAKRQAENRSKWQFSLSALFFGITLACVLLALAAMQRRADLERHAQRQRLEEAIMKIVGQGEVRVSGTTTLIQVKRPSFDDDDFRKVLQLQSQLDEMAPLVLLDLSNTQVTDESIGELRNVDSLEFCFLQGTQVSDASIDAIGKLPNLKMLSVRSTRVTPEKLLELSSERPALNVEPKTYTKLKAR